MSLSHKDTHARARAHTLYPYTLDLILTYVCCASTRPSTVTELPLYFCVCVCSAPSYFCMSSSQTAPFLNFSPSLPLSACVCVSLSLSLWRWGQRAISCALQTSLGGETLSTVSAGAGQRGALATTRRHKLSSPLHTDSKSHDKKKKKKNPAPSVLVSATCHRLRRATFLFFWSRGERENGWKNWVGWR